MLGVRRAGPDTPGGKWPSSARTDGMQIGAYLSTPRSEKRKAWVGALARGARGSLLSASADVGSPVPLKTDPRDGGALPRERAGSRTVRVQAVTEHRPPPLSRPGRAIILLPARDFPFSTSPSHKTPSAEEACIPPQRASRMAPKGFRDSPNGPNCAG